MKILSVNLVKNYDLLLRQIRLRQYDFIVVSEPYTDKSNPFKWLKSFSVHYHDPITNGLGQDDILIFVNRRYKLDLYRVQKGYYQIIVDFKGGLRLIGVHMPNNNGADVLDWLADYVTDNTIVAGDFNNQLQEWRRRFPNHHFTNAVTTVKQSRIDNIVIGRQYTGRYRVIEGRDHHLLEWIGDDDSDDFVQVDKEDGVDEKDTPNSPP